MQLFYIILLTSLGSLVSLSAGLILLLRKNWSQRFTLTLTSFAAGVLLATAFFDLLPESQELILEKTGGDMFLPVFLGIFVFFLFERTFVWFHHHHTDHGAKPTIWTVTFGDGVHNFIDGVAIAAAYLLNPVLGFTTAVAVAAHEIPQEIADFSILLSHGLSRQKATIFNISSAATALFGAVGMYFFAPLFEKYLGSIIAFSAGMFIYIALSDLIPELHHAQAKKDTLPHSIAFVIGVCVIFLTKMVLAKFLVDV